MSKTKYDINEATLIMAIVWAIMYLTIAGKRHSESEIADLLGLSLGARKTIRKYLNMLTILHVTWKTIPPQEHYGRGRNTFYATNPYLISESVWKTQLGRTTLYCYKQGAVMTGLVKRKGKRDYFLNGKLLYANYGDQIQRSLREGLWRNGRQQNILDYEIERVIIRVLDETKLIESMNDYKFQIKPNFLETFRDYLICIYHTEYDGVALS